MLDLTNLSMPSVEGASSTNLFGRANSIKAAELSPKTDEQPPEENNSSDTGELSQAASEQLKRDFSTLHHVDIQFSVHEETGKTVIKIIDKDSNEVIREIPSGEDLERAARLRTFVGKLFDTVA